MRGRPGGFVAGNLADHRQEGRVDRQFAAYPIGSALPIRFAQLPVCPDPPDLATGAAARQGPLQAASRLCRCVRLSESDRQRRFSGTAMPGIFPFESRV